MKKEPVSQKEEKRDLRKTKKIVYIICSAFLLIALVVLLVKSFVASQVDTASVRAEKFLNELDDKNFSAAFSLLSDDEKSTSNPELFQFNVDIMRNSLGAFSNRELKASKVQLNDGVLTVTAYYNSKFQYDSTSEEVVAAKSNLFSRGWKIVEYHTNSDKIIKY